MSLRDMGYEYVLICPKCGRVTMGIKDRPMYLCDVCQQAYLVKTDFDFDTYCNTHSDEEAYEMDQRVREQYGIEKLDPKCIRIREEHDRTIWKHLPPLPYSSPVVECPYCHSTNTTKITTAQKAINTGLFGIFGNKRRYQWHCNSCKSDF